MEHLNPERTRVMLKTYASRMAAGAVISAALTAGSLGLTATAASACTDPKCLNGIPPGAASAMECTNPKCLNGIPPVAASAMECTNPKCLSGIPPVAAHAGTSTIINCPPPNPELTALIRGISDC
jgi:hypothetical protein